MFSDCSLSGALSSLCDGVEDRPGVESRAGVSPADERLSVDRISDCTFRIPELSASLRDERLSLEAGTGSDATALITCPGVEPHTGSETPLTISTKWATFATKPLT
jgi:hypothetical protein